MFRHATATVATRSVRWVTACAPVQARIGRQITANNGTTHVMRLASSSLSTSATSALDVVMTSTLKNDSDKTGTEGKDSEKVLISACGDVKEDDDDDELDEEEMFVNPHDSFQFQQKEWGGPRRGGRLAEPTRFGDWERKGRCTDF